MAENVTFEAAHRFVEKWEGGWSDDAKDPGGATKYGVSLRFLRSEGIDIDGDGDVDVDDVRAVTKVKAKEIFRKYFWPDDFEKLSQTHPRLAFAAYDTAVNMGLGWAKRFIQRAVGTKEDGVFGPLTWGAIKESSDFIAACYLIDFRRARYEYLVKLNPDLKVFLRGWMNRVNALLVEVSK